MAGEFINEFGYDIESITLVRGEKSRFDVSVNGQLAFSKAVEKRHAQPGEVIERVRNMGAASGRDLTRYSV